MNNPVHQPWFVVVVAQTLRFYSILPVPRLPGEARFDGKLDFGSMALAAPVAGAIIGAVSALALALAHGLGLGISVAAISAAACGVVVTGALHEDGIADTADGIFADGGAERRLEIMRDSRHGSFGVLALIIVMLARTGLLAELSLAGTRAAAAALIGAAALSRAASLMPLVILPPARRDGAGAAAGQVSMVAFGRACLIGCGIALFLSLFAGFGLTRGVLACLAALSACYGVCALAKARIGGQTGDVAGAAQVLAELAVYLVLATGRA